MTKICLVCCNECIGDNSYEWDIFGCDECKRPFDGYYHRSCWDEYFFFIMYCRCLQCIAKSERLNYCNKIKNELNKYICKDVVDYIIFPYIH